MNIKRAIGVGGVLFVLSMLTVFQVQAAPTWEETPTPASSSLDWLGTPVATPSGPTPTPLPFDQILGGQGDGDKNSAGGNGGGDSALGRAGKAAQVLFNPAGSIRELANDMLKDAFKSIDNTLADMLGKVTGWIWDLFTLTPDGGMYSTAAKPFSAVGIVLFVPFAILRLVWYHKHQMTGREDSLVNTGFDVLTAALMIVAIGPLVDWTAKKVYVLNGMIMAKIGLHNLPLHFGVNDILPAMSNTLGALLFSGFLLLGGLLAVLAFAAAFAAVQGVFYILTALGPIVFVLGMLPPFGWLKRLWWMAFGAVVLTPFVGAAALGALAALVSFNYGTDVVLIKFIIRMIWLWAAAGFMWTLLGMMTRFTIAASAQMAGKLVGAAGAAITGLTTAGALAVGGGLGSGLGGMMGRFGNALGLGGGGGTSSGSGGGGGSPASSGTGGGDEDTGLSLPPSEHFDRAADHTLKAGVFGALSNVPGMGGLRGAAAYHRTLADVHRLRASSGAAAVNEAARALKPHDLATQYYSMLTGQGPGSYRTSLKAVQRILGETPINDPELGLVDPETWSQSGDERLAPLAGALAAMYSSDGAHLFEAFNPGRDDQWLEIKREALKRIAPLKGSDIGGDE